MKINPKLVVLSVLLLLPIAVAGQETAEQKEERRQSLQRKTYVLIDEIASAALGLKLPENRSFILAETASLLWEHEEKRARTLFWDNQSLNKEQQDWNEHNRLVRSNDPEGMFKGASALGDEQRNSLQKLIDALDAEQINQAIGNSDADGLRKIVSQVRLREERARAMTEIAVLLEKNGDHDEAVKLLGEARTLIKVDFDSETQTNALLSLAGAYAIVDPPKAFAILEKTIDRANDQISKLLLVDKIIKTGVIRKGEILLHQASVLPLDFLLFRFGKGVGALATADYERTKAAADRLDRQELRLLARLMLARSLVEFTYKKPRSERG